MKTNAPIYPTIILPGPVCAAYSITVSSTTTTWAGNDITKSVTFRGDGSGQVQVTEYLQDNYSDWHAYLGEIISINYGKGPLRYFLSEQFGEFFLVSVAGWRAS